MRKNYPETGFIFPGSIPLSSEGLPLASKEVDGINYFISCVDGGTGTIQTTFRIEAEGTAPYTKVINGMSAQKYAQKHREFYLWANYNLIQMRKEYKQWQFGNPHQGKKPKH